MGIQVTSLSMGTGIAVATQQEHRQEKQPPLPTELKEAVAQTEAHLLGRLKAPTPDLSKTAAGLEQISLAFNRRLKFVIDEESKEIIIKVIDNETDKVIKVLPPEELQRLHSRIRETIGFLFDRMV